MSSLIWLSILLLKIFKSDHLEAECIVGLLLLLRTGVVHGNRAHYASPSPPSSSPPNYIAQVPTMYKLLYTLLSFALPLKVLHTQQFGGITTHKKMTPENVQEKKQEGNEKHRFYSLTEYYTKTKKYTKPLHKLNTI